MRLEMVAAPATKTSPRRLGLLKLLEPGYPLTLPIFQRSYAWEQRQVDDYWRDLKAALDAPGGPSDYFMGLVVVDERRRIQDGQQRLATTLIFVQELYAAAKSVMKQAAKYQEKLSDEIAGVLAPLISEQKSVLEISPSDQAELLQRAGIAAVLPESTRRLAAARMTLRLHLEVEIASKTPNASLARLLAWAQYLEDSAYVVELEVPSPLAHKIFEALNTRGVRLKNGDLVKSLLLANASNHHSAEVLWGQVIEALEDSDGDYESNLDDFLYHYYGSRYGTVVSKDRLFEAFAKQVAGLDPLDVLEELRINAECYSGFIDPLGAPILKNHSDDAKYGIRFMNGMKFRQLRFLLLAVLRDYAAGEPKAQARSSRQSELIEKIAAWSVRSLVTGRVGGQSAQRVFVDAAKAIAGGTSTSVSDVRRRFLDKRLFVETDATFRQEFTRWSFDDQQARALLFELERAELGANAAMRLKGDLTLEHVLPKRPKSGTWSDFQGDDRTIYPYRVGNLLLLAQPFNSSLGNIEWVEKRAKIKAEKGSQTPLTQAASLKTEWDRKTIDARSKTLARKASDRWPA